VASVTLHAAPHDPKVPSRPWAPNSLNIRCRMLGNGQQDRISLPTPGGYRLSLSMDLTIDDGLDCRRWSR
jgi:hypothetical protein